MRTIAANNTIKSNTLTEIFSVSGWLMFLLAVVAGCLNVYLVQEFVLTDDVYYNTLGERLAYERIEKMLAEQREWSWLGYAFIPVMVFLQTLVISLCLVTGVIFSYAKVSFKRIFGMVLKVIALIAVIRLLPSLVLLFQDIQVLDDLFTSDWYSMLALVGRDNIATWLHVPLASLNVFHLLLLLGLLAGMRHLSDKPTRRMALISYGCGTLLWWVGLMYVQVSLG